MSDNFKERKMNDMTGPETCNLIDSLTKRGLEDSEIIEIIFETEGRQRQKKQDEDKAQ